MRVLRPGHKLFFFCARTQSLALLPSLLLDVVVIIAVVTISLYACKYRMPLYEWCAFIFFVLVLCSVCVCAYLWDFQVFLWFVT